MQSSDKKQLFNLALQYRTKPKLIVSGGKKMKGSAVNTRVKTRTGEKAAATTEISKAGIYTMGIASALIGVWGLACFVGGMIASGGPLSFIGNWFKAVAGL